MKLQALIDTLEANIGRAEDDNWTALCLQVPEAEELMREMVALKASCEAVRQFPGVVEYVGTQIMDMLDAAIETPNAPHEGPGAASSRTVPLDAVVGRHFTGEDK